MSSLYCKAIFVTLNSKASFYKWKGKYSGMSVSELKRLKELEEENRRLKQMYANLSLEHEALKEIIEKKL